MINFSGKFRQFRRSLDAGPDHGGTAMVREEADASQFQIEGRRPRYGGESLTNRGQLFSGHLADEFQGDVQVGGIHPARLAVGAAEFADERRQLATHVRGDRERNKETHRYLRWGGAWPL